MELLGQQDVIKMMRQAMCNPHTSIMRAVILNSTGKHGVTAPVNMLMKTEPRAALEH